MRPFLPPSVMAILLFGSSMLAQTQSPAEPPSLKLVLTIDVAGVSFAVTDGRGQFIKDLGQEQFTILDNNKPPKRIVFFESQTAQPLRVGLLVDTSASMKRKLPGLQQILQPFLRELIRPDSDKALVLAFDEVPVIAADFSGDQTKLAEGLNSMRGGGGSAIWDSVYFTCHDKLAKENDPGAVRRIIVLVTDGDDNGSRVTLEEAIRMAQQWEVAVYTINTGGASGRSEGDLRTLSEATGGQAFFPANSKEMWANLEAIVEELRAQYFIGYTPDALLHDGTFHSIKIVPKDRKFKIRAKKGYFVPKQ